MQCCFSFCCLITISPMFLYCLHNYFSKTTCFCKWKCHRFCWHSLHADHFIICPILGILDIRLQWSEFAFCCFWWNILSDIFPGPDCSVGRKVWFMIQALAFTKGFLTSSKACMSCTVFLPAAVESSWFKDRICFEISLNQACRFSMNTETRRDCWDPRIPIAVALDLFSNPLQI